MQGKRVTGFTNTEEEAVGLTKVVPFLVEDELKAKGGIYSKAGGWQSYVVTDGLDHRSKSSLVRSGGKGAAATPGKTSGDGGARVPSQDT